jgi:hypothetical protein
MAIYEMTITPPGNVRPPEVLFGNQHKDGWNDILPESITEVFKKWCKSNDKNGTENDVLWQEIH